MKNPFDLIDKEVLEDVKFFFNQLNDRYLYTKGYKDSYNDHGIPALHESVEYFHYAILADDRMCYIAENIVSSDLNQNNKICNTIISHFYGGRGIHQVATKELDPKKAHVDFERLLVDNDYRNLIVSNLESARDYGIPIYGTTELRTSLFGAANEYVAKKYNKERDASAGNIMLWVASFIERGITEKMQNVKSLKEMFNIITQLEGVGQYYGYHCSTSNSVNPNIDINHDEYFCVPGPGARKTLDLLFPNVSPKEFDYGDRIVWIRQNQKELLGEFPFHESLHNLEINGQKLFKEDQNEFKTYGMEVACCQASVYHRLKNEPKLAGRRKVARIDDSIFEKFIKGEKMIPVTAKTLVPKDKIVQKKKEDLIIDSMNEKFTKLPDGYVDPFPEIHLKDPETYKRSNKVITETEAHKKVVDVAIKEAIKEVRAPKAVRDKIIKPKAEKKAASVPSSSPEKIELIKSIIDELNKEEFGHSDVLEVVLEKGGLGLKLESNWKESWAIMQSMVDKGMLEKIGRKYKIK